AALQAAAAQQLLDDVVETPLAPDAQAPDLVHARDAGVDRVEADVGLGREARVEDLERDARARLEAAPAARSDGAIDRPHGSGPEQAVEAVAADLVGQRGERKRLLRHGIGSG